MKFIEIKLKGAYIIETERLKDERGFFARTFCRKEFEAHGLNTNMAQCNIPEGLVHDYQTLVDDTVVFYQMFEFHHPECARGVRWDDPAFDIK